MKEALKAAIKAAQDNLDIATKALAEFEAKAENNVFEAMDEAESAIEEKLSTEARNDCEGSYQCGADEYTQEFMVDGIVYVGTLTVEYNRHDKTYYYVDGTEFKAEKKQSETQ